MDILGSIRTKFTGKERHRIVVIGAQNSGKTVFLTSLINHLEFQKLFFKRHFRSFFF